MLYKNLDKRSKTKRALLAVVVTAVGLIIPLCVMDNRPFIYKWHNAYKLEEPVHLSHHAVVDLAGKEHSLAEFSGKPTIVMFWATWCGICARELPEVSAYYSRARERINIVPVAMPDDPPEKVAWFFERFGGGELSAYIAKSPVMHRKLGVAGVPNFFLLDKHGRAVAKMRPRWDAPDLDRLVEMLLANEGDGDGETAR